MPHRATGYAATMAWILGLIAVAVELALALAFMANAGGLAEPTLAPHWTDLVPHRTAVTLDPSPAVHPPGP